MTCRRSITVITIAGLLGFSALLGGAWPSIGPRAAVAASSGQSDVPVFPNHSKWNFTRMLPNGLAQKGALRIDDGLIFHLDAPQSVGRAYQDGLGRLHLEFLGHRKIAVGEAIVFKVASGRWQGILLMGGISWGLDMQRRC